MYFLGVLMLFIWWLKVCCDGVVVDVDEVWIRDMRLVNVYGMYGW